MDDRNVDAVTWERVPGPSLEPPFVGEMEDLSARRAFCVEQNLPIPEPRWYEIKAWQRAIDWEIEVKIYQQQWDRNLPWEEFKALVRRQVGILLSDDDYPDDAPLLAKELSEFEKESRKWKLAQRSFMDAWWERRLALAKERDVIHAVRADLNGSSTAKLAGYRKTKP